VLAYFNTNGMNASIPMYKSCHIETSAISYFTDYTESSPNAFGTKHINDSSPVCNTEYIYFLFKDTDLPKEMYLILNFIPPT